MKTSFTKTLYDYSKNRLSRDNITNSDGFCELRNNNGIINQDEIFIINSYDDNYEYRENVASLLISKDLKQQYDKIKGEIDSIRKNVIEFLRIRSGLQAKELEPKLLDVFKERNFIDIWPALEYKLNAELKNNFARIKYSLIFNDNVIALLKDQDFQLKLQKYLQIYDTLINQSSILKRTDKSSFDHNNVKDILKNLKNNGFFLSETNDDGNPIRSLRIWTGKEYESFAKAKDLEDRIEHEIRAVEENQDYRNAFKEISAKFEKPKNLKEFGEFIKNNKSILNELKMDNLDLFEKEVWISYFHEKKDLCLELITKIKQSTEEIKNIQQEALKPEALQIWREIIEEYNRNFLIIDNKLEIIEDDFMDIVLGLKSFQINIRYKDGRIYKDFNSEKVSLDGIHLVRDILSQGEKRVLYLLNVMFDIKVRKKQKNESGQEIKTLFIIDDIADSFDYQNKYAIIEYLKKIAYENKFYQIILTHNYDFFRSVKRKLCDNKQIKCETLIGTRFDWGVRLDLYDKKLDNPFKQWKDIGTVQHLICLIPFIRNIAEYTGDSNGVYDTLTSLLHIKHQRHLSNSNSIIKDTKDIKIQDLIDIMNKIVKVTDNTLRNKRTIDFDNIAVFDLITQEADKCSGNRVEHFGIEDKIVLSIAIRLKAEDFVINEILKIDNTFNLSAISENQAIQLFLKYKNTCQQQSNFNTAKKTLEKVDLITSENIHINSFMYEPIIDMSCEHLKNLYKCHASILKIFINKYLTYIVRVFTKIFLNYNFIH